MRRIIIILLIAGLLLTCGCVGSAPISATVYDKYQTLSGGCTNNYLNTSIGTFELHDTGQYRWIEVGKTYRFILYSGNMVGELAP